MDKKGINNINNILKWENEKDIIDSASKIGNDIKKDRSFDFKKFYECVIKAKCIEDVKKCINCIKNENLKDLKNIIEKIQSEEDLENFKEFVELLKFFSEGYGIYSNEWINKVLDLNEKNVADVIRYAKILAYEFGNIPSSKFRKFYDYVLKVYENRDKNNWYVELYRLKSFIAYNIGRETGKKKNALIKFSKIFEKLIDKIKNDCDRFEKFKKFFEAVVAYHRAYND